MRAGERVAADGEVVEGDSDVDQGILTGEPLLVAKTVGAPVTGGKVNGTGTLICRTRLPIQSLVDQITLRFVPVVLVIVVLAALMWAILGPEPRISCTLLVAVSVLIIACPCAMGLATSTRSNPSPAT